MIVIRLPKKIEHRIAVLAKRTGRTESFYVREAIMAQLDDLEDKYLALDRLENPGKRWTLEQLEQGLDLDC